MLIGLFSKMLSLTALLVKESRLSPTKLQTSVHALKKPIAIIVIKLFPRSEGCAGREFKNHNKLNVLGFWHS